MLQEKARKQDMTIHLRRPGECGACRAKILLPPRQQIELATSFAPEISEHFGGSIIAQTRLGKKTPENPSGRFKLYKIRTVRDESPPPYTTWPPDIRTQTRASSNTSLHKDSKAGWKPLPYGTSRFGKFLRENFIDEIPQLFQLLTNLKLVGVRPYSIASGSLISHERRERLQSHKPGLMNILYASAPGEIYSEELRIQAERRYLDAYESDPLFTDALYFCLIVKHVVSTWIPFLRGRKKE